MTESAASWVAASRPDAEVYRGGRLEAAEEFAASHPGELTAVKAEFVAAGVSARERDAAAERERFELILKFHTELRALVT